MSFIESKTMSPNDFCQPTAISPMGLWSHRVLLVEPDAALRGTIAASLASVAVVDAQHDFGAARACLLSSKYDLVATNLRLAEYNGLHLAYLAQQLNPDLRVVVYAHDRDIGMASEVQRANAFFERSKHIVGALASYVGSSLPPQDRRDPRVAIAAWPASEARRMSDGPAVHGAATVLVKNASTNSTF